MWTIAIPMQIRGHFFFFFPYVTCMFGIWAPFLFFSFLFSKKKKSRRVPRAPILHPIEVELNMLTMLLVFFFFCYCFFIWYQMNFYLRDLGWFFVIVRVMQLNLTIKKEHFLFWVCLFCFWLRDGLVFVRKLKMKRQVSSKKIPFALEFSHCNASFLNEIWDNKYKYDI